MVFFAIVNAIKVAPSAALGQFNAENLAASPMLAPVAVAATLAGVAIVKRLRADIFYPIVYTALLIVALKLLHDGFLGITG